MAQPNILDLIKGTLQEIQKNTQNNPQQQKADPSIFDFLKDKLSEVDRNTKTTIEDKNGNNVGIFDVLLDKINGAQKENQTNPNVETAPGSIFDMLRDAVTQQKTQSTQRSTKRAEESIEDLIQHYNLDVRSLSYSTLQQIQDQYAKDNAELDRKYAQHIHDLIQKSR